MHFLKVLKVLQSWQLSKYDFVVSGALLHDVYVDEVNGGHFGASPIPGYVFDNYQRRLLEIKKIVAKNNKPKLIWFKQYKVRELRTKKVGKYFRNEVIKQMNDIASKIFSSKAFYDVIMRFTLLDY